MKPVSENPVLPAPGMRSPGELLRAFLAALTPLLSALGYRLNRTLPKDGSEAMTAPLVLATYTVATRPAAASWTGGIIYVSDGGAGAVFQGSNGAAWVNLG